MSAETIAFVLALAFAAQTVVVCIVLLRLLPVLREAKDLAAKLQDVLGRLNSITGNLESASMGVKQMEQRVRGVVSRVMDEIEPPVRSLAAFATGIRTTVQSLIRRQGSANGHPEPTVTERGVVR